MSTEIDNDTETERYSDEQISSLLVHPAADANKYTRGKLVVVAGSGAYPGAACLTSFAAQRMGAGYVEVICDPKSADVVRASRASLVVRSWDGWRFADSVELTEQRADSAELTEHHADSAGLDNQRADNAGSDNQRAIQGESAQQHANQAELEEQRVGDAADRAQQCVGNAVAPGQQHAENQEVALPQHFATHVAKHPAACVIGSGFDAHGKTEQKLVLAALREVAAPLLVDGGAISVLATSEGIAAAHERAERGWSLVVTPHGGEAARMEYAARLGADANAADRTGVDTSAHADRAQTAIPAGSTPTSAGSAPTQAPADSAAQDAAQASRAQALATTYRCVVVLKGSDTYLSDGKRTVAMLQGTAALAKAGTGDVLAGMIGALLAQNVNPLDACVAGTTIHAKAGCDAAARLGDISVTAEDVIASIPSVIYDLGFPNRIL